MDHHPHRRARRPRSGPPDHIAEKHSRDHVDRHGDSNALNLTPPQRHRRLSTTPAATVTIYRSSSSPAATPHYYHRLRGSATA